MSAKEHCERVRFDPKLVAHKLPHSGFKLIFPSDAAPGEDPDLYLRVQKKSFEIFRSATGTIPAKRQLEAEQLELQKKKAAAAAKKKKLKALKKAKKKESQLTAEVVEAEEPTEEEEKPLPEPYGVVQEEPTQQQDGEDTLLSQEEEDQLESNWQDGDPQVEEQQVVEHL